jgi:hypothetical protein
LAGKVVISSRGVLLGEHCHVEVFACETMPNQSLLPVAETKHKHCFGEMKDGEVVNRNFWYNLVLSTSNEKTCAIPTVACVGLDS